jgi:NAD(P)-dependent dehydrogenase (short-subunit alcohol dehydrogenase family)
MKRNHTIIIGGTSGAGKTIAQRLLALGHTASIIGRRKITLEGPRAHTWQADITNRAELTVALSDAISKGGKLQYLVFAQRYRGDGDPWDGEIHTSLTATKQIVELLTPEFAPDGDKSIVMLSSVYGSFIGDGQPIGYHVAKAGLNQMMRFYARELAPRGIRVNAISPSTYLKDDSRTFYAEDEHTNMMCSRVIPLGRLGDVADIGEVTAFLCSEAARYITGNNLVLDGGLSLVWQDSVAKRMKKG